MSCQPHRAPEVSQTQVISKCTFKKTLLISKCLVKSVHKILLISKRLVKLVHKTNHFANMKQNIHTKTSIFFWEKRIIKHQDKPNTSNACFHMDDFLQYFLQYAIFYNTTGPLLWRAVENCKSFTLSLINLLSSLISSSFRSSLLLITSTSPKWLRIASARRRTGASVCRTNKSLLTSKLLTTSIYHKASGVWRQGEVGGGGEGRGKVGHIEPKQILFGRINIWTFNCAWLCLHPSSRLKLWQPTMCHSGIAVAG